LYSSSNIVAYSPFTGIARLVVLAILATSSMKNRLKTLTGGGRRRNSLSRCSLMVRRIISRCTALGIDAAPGVTDAQSTSLPGTFSSELVAAGPTRIVADLRMLAYRADGWFPAPGRSRPATVMASRRTTPAEFSRSTSMLAVITPRLLLRRNQLHIGLVVTALRRWPAMRPRFASPGFCS
jgi:hypothetical protein